MSRGEDFNTRIETVYYSTGPGLTASNVPAYTAVLYCASDGNSVRPMSAMSLSDADNFAGFTREDGLTVARHGSIVKDGPCKVHVGGGGITVGEQTTLSASGKLILWSATTHNVTMGIAGVTAVSDDIARHWLSPHVLTCNS